VNGLSPAKASAVERLLIAYARGFPIRRGKMRIINALWRSGAGAGHLRLAALRRGGMVMPCDLEEMLQRQFYFFGTYFLEEHILDCWAAAARAARTVFDVGANAGIYALEALASGPQVQAHAFEPTPEIAARLRETCALNGLEERLCVHELAVSEDDGEGLLRRFRGETGDNEGMNYVVKGPRTPRAEPVRTVRLDGFCAARGIADIDLLKLDIQGGEASALRGAGRLITEGRVATIFMELNWGEAADCPASQAVRLLDQAGYLFALAGRAAAPRPPGDWLRSHCDVVAYAPGNEGEPAR
jgi:FkbM family methyltransferase